MHYEGKLKLRWQSNLSYVTFQGKTLKYGHIKSGGH